MQEMGTMQQQQIRQGVAQHQQFTQSPAQFYQGNVPSMVPPPVQHNGIQFNSPPQHQWIQSPHQPQIPHTAQPPPQRNPT